MDSRKKSQTPRMDRKTLILTVVGAALVIAIIVIAVVLMQRSGGDPYQDNYDAAMEHYVAGEYGEALDAARRAYSAEATEDAVLIIARSYAALGDLGGAVEALEGWAATGGSGAEASALLEEYRAQLAEQEQEQLTVTIAGERYALDSQTLAITGRKLTAEDLEAVSALTRLSSLSLNSCSLSDISALSSLTQLTTLSLEDNDISDLTRSPPCARWRPSTWAATRISAPWSRSRR